MAFPYSPYFIHFVFSHLGISFLHIVLFLTFSNTRDKGDVSLESCIKGERDNLALLQGSDGENLCMYTNVINDLGMSILFTIFYFKVLRTINVAPSQLHPNNCTFIMAFEIISRNLEIMPIIAIFFSFDGTKGVERVDGYL